MTGPDIDEYSVYSLLGTQYSLVGFPVDNGRWKGVGRGGLGHAAQITKCAPENI